MSHRADRQPILLTGQFDTGQFDTGQFDTEQRARIFAALADPTRLRIVELLMHHCELSGSEIASSLGISLALFCHHNKILTEANVVDIRREGQTRYASLNRQILSQCFSSLTELTRGN